MPLNLKKSPQYREIFDWNMEDVKDQFEDLSGLIIIDSLDNLDTFKKDIEEFSCHTGLQVKATKAVGLAGLKAVIDEALKKLQNSSWNAK